MQKYICVDLLT